MDARPPFDPPELEKRDVALLAGLRAALAGDEHRLYRSGKLAGVFPYKSAVLGEMRDMLAVARSGIPVGQDEMLKSLERLAGDITGEMARYLGKLDALSTRVEEALRRAEV